MNPVARDELITMNLFLIPIAALTSGIAGVLAMLVLDAIMVALYKMVN